VRVPLAAAALPLILSLSKEKRLASMS
jgi:hypothetical protein